MGGVMQGVGGGGVVARISHAHTGLVATHARLLSSQGRATLHVRWRTNTGAARSVGGVMQGVPPQSVMCVCVCTVHDQLGV